MTQERKETVDVTIKRTPERASHTGVLYRAYLHPEGDPLYMGAETLDELEQRVIENFSHKAVNFLFEH